MVISIPFLVDTLLISGLIALMFLLAIGLSRITFIVFDLSENNIFGRVWQSTYIRSMLRNNLSIVTQKNIHKLRGLFARWHKNMHENIYFQLPLVLMLLVLLIPILGFFVGINVFTEDISRIDGQFLWNSIFWSAGILVTALFFFSRYVTNEMDTITKLRYFPYLSMSITAYCVSILYSTPFAYSLLISEPGESYESLAVFGVSFLIISIPILIFILIRIIKVSFTDGLRKIQERAAKRVIFKQSSNEGRIHISERLIDDVASKFTNGTGEHIELSGEDVGITEKGYITDINRSKIQYAFESHDDSIHDVNIHANIGDNVSPSETLVSLKVSYNADKEMVESLFVNLFKTNDFNPWTEYLRGDVEENQAFDDYVAKIEENCKTAIERGNILQLKYYLRSYIQLSSVIGFQRKAYKEEWVRLPECSELLAGSLASLFRHYYSAQDDDFNNPRDSRILSELIQSIYKSYDYSEEDLLLAEYHVFSRLLLDVRDKVSNNTLEQSITDEDIRKKLDMK